MLAAALPILTGVLKAVLSLGVCLTVVVAVFLLVTPQPPKDDD